MNYIYKKGAGWSPEPAYRVFRFKEGFVRLEPRLPNPGEKYAVFGKYDRDDGIVKNGEIQYNELLKNWGVTTHLKYFNTHEVTTELKTAKFIYITLVPV